MLDISQSQVITRQNKEKEENAAKYSIKNL